MNKYHEAFENIKNECAKYHNFDIVDDCITLKELVEKATPIKKELRETGELIEYYICPKCHTKVNELSRYCENCGQRIDGLE